MLSGGQKARINLARLKTHFIILMLSIMVGGFLCEKNLFLLFKLRRLRKIICKKNGEETFFTFCDKEKNLFGISLNLLRRIDSSIKIHRQLSYVIRICGVISYLRTRTVLDLVVSSQVSFHSCPIFFMSGQKPTRKFIAHFRLRRSRKCENPVKPAGSASNKIFGS